MTEPIAGSPALRLLAGIQVLSLEQYISAPYCTQILSEAGAEVIKIERPGIGDPRRSYEPRIPMGETELSGGFASYNRGKRSLALDISIAIDRQRLLRMLERADVLVSNLRPGALERADLAPTMLRERFPRLVICEVSGFGSTGGPLGDRSAFDSVIQAMSGLSGLLGSEPDDPPQLAPMSTMDLLAGIWAALGVSLALNARERTGQGALVDVAMFDIGAAFVERALTLFEFTGTAPVRGLDRYSPVGTFRAADGAWVAIVIPTDDMWSRCCLAIDRKDLVNDPKLDSTAKRAERMKDLILPSLEEWARKVNLSADEAVARLEAAGQPAGIVADIAAVRESAQLAHRGLFVPVEGMGVDGPALVRMPLQFDGRGSKPGPVPPLGEYSGGPDD